VHKPHNWGFSFWKTGGTKPKMTQQADDKQTTDPAGTQDGTQAPEVDPQVGGDDQIPDRVVELAQRMGWNPDYNGENAVDAETYILRGREINDGLSKRVRSLSKEITALRDGIDTIKWSAEQQGKREVARLRAEITTLKAERDAALNAEIVDPAAIRKFDAQIDHLQEAATQQEIAKPPQVQHNEGNAVFEQWVDRNSWYERDNDMQQWANNLSHDPAYQALPYPARLERISMEAQRVFPDKFPKAKAKEPAQTLDPQTSQSHSSAVAPVSPSRQRAAPKAKTAKATADDLSFHERKAGESFVAMGFYKDLNEYAQKLAEHEAAAHQGGHQW
jgi:hypothetical protein